MLVGSAHCASSNIIKPGFWCDKVTTCTNQRSECPFSALLRRHFERRVTPSLGTDSSSAKRRIVRPGRALREQRVKLVQLSFVCHRAKSGGALQLAMVG